MIQMRYTDHRRTTKNHVSSVLKFGQIQKMTMALHTQDTLCFSFEFSPRSGCYISQRYLLTFMGFLGLVMAYSMRLSLSVAITQMVPPPIFASINLTTINGEPPIICPFQDENYNHEHFDYQAIFDSLYSVNLN